MTFFENIEFKRFYYYLYNTMKENCITNMYLSKRNPIFCLSKTLRAGKGNFPFLA